ncbi:rap guanine nucleotide exchange factor 1 isoform X3 [Macrosteles quadrilineatus]|uniref:rap guanine nucleotide exchange factor 1 isoform X3 n=1 Tax=Macrosteles quadrilineatus TaxID=74068 RepID=UPI0023E3405E|nr:rap guanine nucleotide exchange factor 1 isoform X3 [Macrosteles quadrilineatus]
MPGYDDSFLSVPDRRVTKYKVRESKPCVGALVSSVSLNYFGYDLDSGDSNEGTPRAKGGKLARRARSFKEDFLDILAQMRSPATARAGSPKPSPKHRTTSGSEPPPELERNPLRDMEIHVRQVQFALKHFRDVVSRNKLEVLPGNGTVVLESVTTIHSVLKTYVFVEQSSALVSAMNQVYQSLAKLIRLCDDVLLLGDKAISKENVTEVIQQVEEAVQNLVSLASAKIAERSNKALNHSKPTLDRSSTYSVEFSGRSSLPDIPLTPRERQILEQTSQTVVPRHAPHHSLSSESILHDDVPPPKPPLPNRSWTSESPPPLPPKRRPANFPSQSMERLSLRSTNSSLGSMDSMLNSSLRDDDELQALVDEDSSINMDSVQHTHGIGGSLLNGSSGSCCCWDSSCSNISQDHRDSPPLPPATLTTVAAERISSSSGFVSMRSSTQSYNYSTASSKSVSSATSTQVAVSENKSQSVASVTQSDNSQSLTVTTSQKITSSQTQSFSNVVTVTPPALPVKQRSRRERQPSQYDNVPSTNHTQADLLGSSPTRPPPLPLKKKHMFQSVAYSVMAYMEMFGNCSQPNTSEYLRHSVHTATYSLMQAEWQQHQVTLSSTQSCSFNMLTRHSSPAASPNPRCVSPQSSTPVTGDDPPALPPKQRDRHASAASPPPASPVPALTPTPPPPKEKEKEVVETRLALPLTNGAQLAPDSPLDMLDITGLLVLKKCEEEGPDVRGGHPDALIIHATKANKNDFLYQEAFLTTYRTFLTPLDLIEKLCHRHERFTRSSDQSKQRAAREAFSLLVRVVSDLTISDLETTVIQTLTDFVYQLLCNGDLIMAKALRVKILEKYNIKRLYHATSNLLPSQNVYTRQASLLDFKSEHIAEQMTLLDSELFMKIEIPEVLIWAQEQNEERSPNLTRFTEHFNKMSYWARSRILEQPDAKEREKYVVKFIKIMKHLRKINNFNSYLALLSALDSAPIRRLEWQKHITEGLKEYCALIDSSSSFRAYRQALAETQPPCIPYIGLVLQDLTFVHIGNSDYLTDGVINFSKRWQQFNIVENMKRFKKGTYVFKKSERIIAFFSNFDEFLCEEAMWQISESIKPRGSKKPVQ